ncbi:uncharacterized protein EI97DRAFT_430114, partial [Westerdykella ornata]
MANGKQQKRLAQQKERIEQFKRAQRYLGLRPENPGVPPPVDCSNPLSLPFHQSVVFVSIDVEAYEKDHSKILEIGVAILDTRSLLDTPPGVDGENWRSKIQARHFLIKENQHLRNYEFVRGCPDRFEFGTSTTIPLEVAAAAVEGCFLPPFGGSMELNDGIELEQRKVVLVGHDTQTDMEYLKKIGFDALRQDSVVDCLDSALLYRTWRQDPQITSLGKVLADFDIVGWNLHNAGNDAVYTMQAMLAVCVRESTIRAAAQTEVTLEPKAAEEAEEEEEVWP